MNHSEAGKKGYEKTEQLLNEYRRHKSQRCIEEYEANPQYCLFCGANIPFEKRRNKFCSKSCSASFNNQCVTRNPQKDRFCASCGKRLSKRNKYCDDCAQKHVYHRSKSVEHARTDEARKRLLVDVRGYRCEICGLSEWMGKPIPIELHHIDGDSDNNKEDNLQLLCSNCHGQTDNHKRRNKNGSRQIMRRNRYANGKTW